MKEADPDMDSADEDAGSTQSRAQSRAHTLFMSHAAVEPAFVDADKVWEMIFDALSDKILPTQASEYKLKLADQKVRPADLVSLLKEKKLEEAYDIIRQALFAGESVRKEGHVVTIAMALTKKYIWSTGHAALV